jgi:hypothetical protein
MKGIINHSNKYKEDEEKIKNFEKLIEKINFNKIEKIHLLKLYQSNKWLQNSNIYMKKVIFMKEEEEETEDTSEESESNKSNSESESDSEEETTVTKFDKKLSSSTITINKNSLKYDMIGW